MICQNCGAEYNNKEMKCPYCHSENPVAAARHKKNILLGFEKEAEQIRQEAENYPKAEAKRRTGILLRILGVLAVVGLTASVLVILIGRRAADSSYNNSQKHKERLEEFYQAGDYEAMSDYLDRKGLYQTTYEKYIQVAQVWDYLQRLADSRQELEAIDAYNYDSPETRQAVFRYRAETYLDRARAVLQMIREKQEDTSFLGNEEVLEELYRQCRDSLFRQGFTEQEINRLEQSEKVESTGDTAGYVGSEEWEILIEKLGREYL
ncbi:MAG: hypothetical protein ACI4HQ_05850 [Acetatifactor sp.]